MGAQLLQLIAMWVGMIAAGAVLVWLLFRFVLKPGSRSSERSGEVDSHDAANADADTQLGLMQHRRGGGGYPG